MVGFHVLQAVEEVNMHPIISVSSIGMVLALTE
jgi:hypothetical protein